MGYANLAGNETFSDKDLSGFLESHIGWRQDQIRFLNCIRIHGHTILFDQLDQQVVAMAKLLPVITGDTPDDGIIQSVDLLVVQRGHNILVIVENTNDQWGFTSDIRLDNAFLTYS